MNNENLSFMGIVAILIIFEIAVFIQFLTVYDNQLKIIENQEYLISMIEVIYDGYS